MSVFSSEPQTTKGIELVRDHVPTCDAQTIHKELKEHCLKSTKAEAECSAMADFPLHARVEKWSGSAFDFLAHMCKQIESHNQKAVSPHSEVDQHHHLEQS